MGEMMGAAMDSETDSDGPKRVTPVAGRAARCAGLELCPVQRQPGNN